MQLVAYSGGFIKLTVTCHETNCQLGKPAVVRSE